MNKKKFINHMNLYIQRYVFIIILLVIIANFLSSFIPDYIESKKAVNYSLLKDSVYKYYELDPSLFNFDENDIAILKMDTLYSDVTNGTETYGVPPLYDDNFDQCAGYILIKNNNNVFDIDLSHICDMIDY